MIKAATSAAASAIVASSGRFWHKTLPGRRSVFDQSDPTARSKSLTPDPVRSPLVGLLLPLSAVIDDSVMTERLMEVDGRSQILRRAACSVFSQKCGAMANCTMARQAAYDISSQYTGMSST